MAKQLVKEYVFQPGLGVPDNARPNAVSLITQNKIFITKEISAYIQNQINAGNPDYLGYSYDLAKCERDAGYLIDALIFDLRYNGNEETRRISTYYWDEEVSQLSSNRVAESDSYEYARDLINNNILTNILLGSPEQLVATQVIDETKTTESGTNDRVINLLDSAVDVINNGLDQLPALEIGLGRIELLGKIELSDVLIITNVTDNIVIYNFAEPTKGGSVRFTDGNSISYPRAESVNNGTTVINFNFDTSGMSSVDDIQVFLESSELKVRMTDIARDAMERIKVGIPQAMLDADFEYGLQPTKWQAISTQRGYPSTYEIPASELPVVNVTTDASSGSNDIGASLITINTSSAHGLNIGNLITVKALSSSVLGFNRAEGTFVVVAVPTNNSLQYYAKAKVGSTNGQVLATETTQLRKAAFYSGAAITTPTFDIPSQGGSGSITTTINAPSGASFLTFNGNAPVNGVALSGTGISSGTQITGVFGGNNTDGIEATKFVKDDFTSGGSTISLSDVSGISTGMVLISGSGPSTTQRVITSIVSNVLTVDGPVDLDYAGDEELYTGVVLSQTNYVQGTGSGATFDINIGAGASPQYSIAAINNSGSGYNQGDALFIAGTALGGTSPTNDLYLNVDTVNSGAIIAVSIISGNTGAAEASFTNIASAQTTNPYITNASMSIQRSAGGYISGPSTTGGSNFQVGQRFLIDGASLGGVSSTNDATVTIATVSAGAPSTYTIAGTAVRGDEIDIYGAFSISEATTGAISAGATLTFSGLATIEVSFPDNHGLVPGQAITVSIETDDGANNHSLAGGPFYINSIPNATTISYIARTEGTIDISVDDVKGSVYIRPDSFFSHRPVDGGVKLGTGGPQHGGQAIRQSKKYIRYQSGKGAMYNTGALFAPSFDISSMTALSTQVGTTITIQTDDEDHGLQSGCRVKINGSQTVGYDGDYTVNSIVDERTFTINATAALGSTTASLGEQCQMSLLEWQGATVRSGCYDDQNGIFWQYDGKELSVVRRSSTFQCAGSIAINENGSQITGTGTRFLDQLQEGDRIVIKGMTHVVSSIASNTTMFVTPGFRGVQNITGAKIAKVVDTVIPQSEWNLDRCDGTGPSGYEIDITKMQMIGIQFTWYGAGFIDWMLRGPTGDYIFCHRLKGNNLNTEAYMRTGNLPVRYEVTNEGPRNRLNGAITNSTSSLTLHNAAAFPDNGTVYIDNEIITYTSKTGNVLSGLTRGATLSNFAGGSTRTYTAGSAASHNDRAGVILISSTTSPIISHWGSAYLIDGEFDDDRGYIFSYPETNIEITTTKQTAFMIRLAPSVSNAITGDLGQRELLNRAQLLLSSLEITSDGTDPADDTPIYGGIVVEGVLNPANYPLNVADVAWSGLSSLAQGGQPSFAQIAAGGGIDWNSGTTQTETAVSIQANMTVTGIQNSFTVDARGSSRDNYVWVLDSDIQSEGLRAGMVCNTVPFNGRTVTSIGALDPDFGDRQLFFDATATNENTNYSANALSLSFTFATERSKSNTLFFTEASWEASGATIGTSVSTSDTNWPANTIVNTVVEKNIGTTNYYEVQFNNVSNGTLNSTNTVTFLFGQPPFAQPGETVFSLIAQPGELSSIDLSYLKELTTTTLGGRGTFPNGPDVLAINVYKVAGDSTTGNILLRWGEAQA